MNLAEAKTLGIAFPERNRRGRGTGSGLGAGPSTPTAGGDRRGGAGGGACVQTGTFGELCADREQQTPDQWLTVYACYWTATCERQGDGRCGWTQDNELNLCVEILRALQI